MSIGGRRHDEVGAMFQFFLAEENIMQKSFPAKRKYFGEFFFFLLPSFSLTGIGSSRQYLPAEFLNLPARAFARSLAITTTLAFNLSTTHHRPPTTYLQR